MRYKDIISEVSNWKHYRKSKRKCLIRRGDDQQTLTIDFGSIETGRTRVFFGFYAQIEHVGFVWYGEDRSCFRSAVREIAASALRDGYTLCAVGLEDDFRETGLSFNSGWGYINDQLAHMLDPYPFNLNKIFSD